MPSIIPDPGTHPNVEPMTAPLEGVSTIDAGTQLYATTIDRIIGGLWNSQVTNNGTVWLENNDIINIHTWFAPGAQTQIWNNGLIYLHGQFQTELSPEGNYLVNAGSIYAISDSGIGRVIGWAAGNVFVDNSGIIAAQGLGIDTADTNYAGSAVTIHSDGSLWLSNHGGGQILAEAPDLAIAIEAAGGEVHNASLIEANSTAPDGISVGVYLWQSIMGSDVFNSGTIRADIAIYGAGDSVFSVDRVHNESLGVIEGFVTLGLGDDQFVNDGTVIGDVDMGRSQDVFSGSGSVSGVVDMGFDNDTYMGSNGVDRAYGGHEEDNLGGNGGNDILFGGFGNDTLHGDAGNDGLIGEWGNDTIATAGGDYVEGGEDNDRIVLGDYSFEKIDGGSGFDTLALAAGARTLNLSSALAGGRLAEIEQVELGGNKTLVVQATDVTALSGGETSLRLVTTSSDHVNLVGSWTHGADQLIDGLAWSTWTQGGVSVLVQGSGIVTPNSAISGSGLDAIAAGDAAPHPGAAAGADYTDTATYVDYFTIFSGDFAVDSREIFYSDTVAFYSDMSEWTFTNNGQIYSINDLYDNAGGLEMKGRISVINNGLIHVESLRPYSPGNFVSPSYGVFMGNLTQLISLDNHGEISVYSATYTAIGVVGGGVIHNDGLISAISETGRALGVTDGFGSDIYTDNHQIFFNTGTIYAEGGGLGLGAYFYGDYLLPITYAAAGVAIRGSLTNDGDIIAVVGADADPTLETVGVYLWNGNFASTVTNNGTIEGTIAIKFATPPGNGGVAHSVINNGQIFGDIEFESFNDQYDGRNGVMQGTVYGFAGDDSFLGGKLSDTFDGGDGNDTLNGGAGIDTASYADALAGVTVSLALAGAQDTGGAGVDTLSNMENLSGSAFADTLTGNGSANSLFGGDGGDTLTGGAGADSLAGGSGNDVFRDTAAGLNGDTITDFAFGDKIVISDASLAGFTYNVSGNTLTYTGGSLTLPAVPLGYHIVASAAAGGGVELTMQFNPTEGDDTIVVNAPWTENTTLDALGGRDSLLVQFDDTGPVTYNVSDPSNAGFLNVFIQRGPLASFVSLDVRHVEDVTLHGTANNDTFSLYIGPNTASSGLTASLDGAAGQDLLRFNWAQLTTGLSFQVSGSTIASSYGSFSSFEIFEIRAGSGNDTITTGGGDDQIYTNGGTDTVNAGGGNDHIEIAPGGGTIDGGTGDDTFVVYDLTSAFSGSIIGGAGADFLQIQATLMTGDISFVVAGSTITSNIGTFSGFEQFQFFAGSGNDTITAGSLDDYLVGGAGNDTIGGGGGNDTVFGMTGDDSLSGGAGNDSITGSEGNDVVDGGDGDDTINGDLSNVTLPGDGNDQLSGGAGHDIIYGAGGNDMISGDADDDELHGGSGADYIDGGDGNDTLLGFGENSGPDDNAANTLLGGNGDDLIYTGRGNDTIDGGAGIDTASYATAGSAVTVNLALIGAQDTLGGGIDTLIGIENLTGTQQNDSLTGNAGANVLVGDFGNDILDGSAGADTLIGGLGDDRFYIDNAGDVVVEAANQGDDIAFVLGTYTLAQGASAETLYALNQAGTDPLVLTGNEFGQSLYGNLGDNYLNGGQGADYLVGLAGNDNLLGGTGADVMQGGTGNDVYYVDEVGDQVLETAGEGNDILVATASYTLAAGASIETMSTEQTTANINLTGNELAQSLYGNAGNNILTGGGGADYMVGGAGNDVYYVDPTDFIGEDVGGGDDTIVVATSYTLREGNEIEALVALNQSSTAPVDFTGNEFGQSLYGSEGVNHLDGGAGNDYLVGEGGNDFLVGGAGNDNMAGGTGNDIYYVDSAGDQIFENAGEGDDLAVCFASFTLGPGQSVETLSANEGSGAINLTGNALGQSIYGNSSANVLTTGGGADYMVGGAGDDTFVFTNAPGVATVGDYIAGDVVDIGQFLSVAGGTNVVGSGYVRIVGSQLQVDANGGGDAFVTIGNVGGSGNVTIRYQSGGSPTDLSVSRSAGQTKAVVAKVALDDGPAHAWVLDGWHAGALHDPLALDPIAPHFDLHGII